jgi:hypothetical protein
MVRFRACFWQGSSAAAGAMLLGLVAAAGCSSKDGASGAVASAKPDRAASHRAQSKPAEPKTISVNVAVPRAVYKTGEKIELTYSARLLPPEGQQYWVTLVPAGAPDTEFGKWHYVKGGAKADELIADAEGEYEIRLHDVYPYYKKGRVLARQRVSVKGQEAPPPLSVNMKIDQTTFKKGQSVAVAFSAALAPPKGQQYWITLVPAGLPDEEWGVWHYVPAGATNDSMPLAASGEMELRLHDLYPLNAKGRVLARQRITVVDCLSNADCAAPAVCAEGLCFVEDAPAPAVAADGLPSNIPAPSSPVPSLAEWRSSGVTVTLRGQPSHCESTMLREWLRVNCRSNGDKGHFSGTDHVRQGGQQAYLWTGDDLGSIVVQVVQGKEYQGRYVFDKEGLFTAYRLEVRWPASSSRPDIAIVDDRTPIPGGM